METRGQLDEAEIDFFERMQSMIGSTPSNKKLSRTIRTVCGVDAAYSTEGNNVVAAAVVFADGRLEETSVYSGRFTFPYISGLFFLHEGPFVVAAVRKLKKLPQLACFDAQGAAHPRFKGLATICGMVLQMPSIGIAKSKLVGRESHYRKGLLKIEFGGRNVGYVTSDPKRYWSPGFSVSVRELERVISQNGDGCLKAMQEAHRLAKEEIRAAVFSKADDHVKDLMIDNLGRY